MKWFEYLIIIGIIIMMGSVVVEVSAVLLNETEVRGEVCGKINLTGTNCTTWWSGLNLTNVSEVNNLNINITYVDNSTGNYTTVHSNFSTIENKTYNYNYYNFTGNISDLNLSDLNTYSKTIIDNKISGLIAASAVDSKLTNYALKTDLSSSNSTTTEIKDIETGWKWAVGVNIFLTILILVAMVILFQQ